MQCTKCLFCSACYCLSPLPWPRTRTRSILRENLSMLNPFPGKVISIAIHPYRILLTAITGSNSLQRKTRKVARRKRISPPGLQKKLARGGELPPGWQKKVARGEVLDWQLYRRSVKLPQDLLRRLPALSQGTELMRLDDRIFRILNDTREILDIFTINH